MKRILYFGALYVLSLFVLELGLYSFAPVDTVIFGIHPFFILEE